MGTQNQLKKDNHRLADTNKVVLPPHWPLFSLTVNKAGCSSGESAEPHGELPLLTEAGALDMVAAAPDSFKHLPSG